MVLTRMTRYGAAAAALLVLHLRPSPAVAQDATWKTYSDTAHGFQLSYPPDYHVEHAGSYYLVKGNVRVEVYVENWTRPISRGQFRWNVDSLAASRAAGACMSDSGECSVSCKITSVDSVPNANGVRVVAVNRQVQSTCARGPHGPLATMYVADLASGGFYYLLIIGPRGGPGFPPDIGREVAASVRRNQE